MNPLTDPRGRFPGRKYNWLLVASVTANEM